MNEGLEGYTWRKICMRIMTAIFECYVWLIVIGKRCISVLGNFEECMTPTEDTT